MNIRYTSETWQGKVTNPTQKGYEEFISLEYGTRAAVKNMLTYYRKHGLKTIQAIINRWAPSSENDTNNYINFVSKKTGWAPTAVLDLENKNVMSELISVMSIMEKGQSQSISANYVYGVIDKFKLM